MWRLRRRAAEQSGAVAVIVAVSALALLVVAALVVDFGLIRVDRQQDKLAADDAAAAGLRAADGGTGDVYNSRAVCTALNFLKANLAGLSGLPANNCSVVNASQICKPADPTTWTTYNASTTSGDKTYDVWIEMPYKTSSTDGGGSWPDESLATLSGDQGDSAQNGCDQIGVIIRQHSRPGLGRIVHSGDIVTRIRSVGRVAVGPGDTAPALLLLDTTHCQVLALSAGGGGADSHIRVYGSEVYQAKRKDGTPGLVDTPGSIHADSIATPADCSGPTGPPIFLGKSSNGIVAYGAPDGSSSGIISSVAAFNGALPGTVSDGLTNTYGTTAKDETTTGTSSVPSGHVAVTRKVVDNRYLGQSATLPTTGVAGAIADAQANVFGLLTSASHAGWQSVNSCNPTAADLSGLTTTSKVFVDCTGNPGYKGTLPIHGQQVVFNGQIQQSANVSLPDAQKVYVFGYSGSGIDASNGFSMHTMTSTGTSLIDPVTHNCQDAPTPDKATLFVKDGGINANGGLLRLCNTTVFLLGNRPSGCLSSIQYVVAPMTTPCGGAAGNGRITIAGTAIQDWTAPNDYNDMSALTNGQRTAEWTDKNGPEDLALWSESYGTSSQWQMSGGGSMHLTGVFMTPNAWPFVVKGGAAQLLSNAQYVASSFLLTGGATLTMKVDANNVISYPMLNPFTMVR